MKPEPVYVEIASLLQARLNCIESGNAEWQHRHQERIAAIVADYLPSGSGIDSGPGFSMEESTPERLVFHVSFHHMNETGFYDGWTEHTIKVTPSLAFGFKLSISGRDRNEIKDYLAECFDYALRQPIKAESQAA